VADAEADRNAASVVPAARTPELAGSASEGSSSFDAEATAANVLARLRTSEHGLTRREAGRRLLQYGSNELRRRGGRTWPRELGRQLTHPLALLLWVAVGLSFAVGSEAVAIAVLLVILLNAVFAFVQELQAERAVEALAGYMPQHATVLRDGRPRTIPAAELVPGDVALLREGDRIPADMRLLSGSLEVDLSTLTGESATVTRAAEIEDAGVPLIAARDVVFGGTSATGGEAHAVVFGTGMHTELGRIAALSERIKPQPSPLERQVRRVAWLIAAIAIVMALAFVPIALVGAGLSLQRSVVFAVGLLAGNVPEGLLPVITLALAVAVSALARRGALVKRLSAVETLGCTDVICTDKTGTLTENRMRPVAAWTLAGEVELASAGRAGRQMPFAALAETAAACNDARIDGEELGDPTEIAMLQAARLLGADTSPALRERERRHRYGFEGRRKLMSTIDAGQGAVWLHTKGAPEAVITRCRSALDASGEERPLDDAIRAQLDAEVQRRARAGFRVLACARRTLPPAARPPARQQAEQGLCFLGLVAMLDPPRAEVKDAVARCHGAGIRVIVITGDHPLTAAAIASRVGIGGPEPRVLDAAEIDHRSERELESLLAGGEELIFARASPEAKLQIASALRASGHVVAMTGDGVNDAPALRCADIGVAMGRSGTDVAREAATMVLTDDNFATIVAAVESGRRVYDNVRKFIVYIFAHATPEVLPFLVFALAGGAVPLPLPVLLLLTFDVGTETFPSLALGRDPAEPDIMLRPPRPRSQGVISAPMLARAWLFLGLIVALLSLGLFFGVLTGAGWHPGDPVDSGTPLHHAYLQASTMTFLGMIAGQVGTAFAVRTQRAPLRSVGALSNPQLLLAVLVELIVAAIVVYAPPLQELLGTAGPPPVDLLALLACPAIVLGAEELRRWLVRRFPQNRSSRLRTVAP
jgi:calcium-translocating P-type ATPase